MGALTGTLTYKQYYVEGELPDNFRDVFLKGIQADAFREIDLDAGEDRHVGWVTLHDLLDAEFTIEKFLFNQYLGLAMREDVVKVPATTLKVYVHKETKEHKQRTGRDKLSKFERDEIKEVVKNQLRRKTLPSIRAFDMVWNLDAKTVWFWTHNRSACETFEEMFERTFELRLVPYNTYCALDFAGMDERTLERVVGLEPIDLVGATDR